MVKKQAVIEKARDSPFLQGDNKEGGWLVLIDFKPANFF
jgi:hypothetical protein